MDNHFNKECHFLLYYVEGIITSTTVCMKQGKILGKRKSKYIIRYDDRLIYSKNYKEKINMKNNIAYVPIKNVFLEEKQMNTFLRKIDKKSVFDVLCDEHCEYENVLYYIRKHFPDNKLNNKIMKTYGLIS